MLQAALAALAQEEDYEHDDDNDFMNNDGMEGDAQPENDHDEEEADAKQQTLMEHIQGDALATCMCSLIPPVSLGFDLVSNRFHLVSSDIPDVKPNTTYPPPPRSTLTHMYSIDRRGRGQEHGS
jgi:hypothetical protein